MTRRVFLNVRRGPMDATAVCVYPWEKRILEHIHASDVEEVSIEQMTDIREGVTKKEKIKLKYDGLPGLDLRQQIEGMEYIDPEEDPALDPATEYGRLAEKYGMDKELPMLVVERVYGQFESGAFTKMLEGHLSDQAEKPSHLKAQGEGIKAPAQMNVAELRIALTDRNIPWKAKEGAEALREKLDGALVD